MNKYTLGTILGTALLGLAKSKLGSNAKSHKVFFDSAIDIRAYFGWEASFDVDEEVSEQQSSWEQSSEQQSSEQQSDWNSSEGFDREEMLDTIEGDIQAMEFHSALNELISELDNYSLDVHIEAKRWRDEGYDIEIGFLLERVNKNIDTWIDLNKVKQEFMEVFERISDDGVDIISKIIEDNLDVEGATLRYVDRNSDLEISENSSKSYPYIISEDGKKIYFRDQKRKLEQSKPNLRKR